MFWTEKKNLKWSNSPELSLIVPDFTLSVCWAIHVILKFLVSIPLFSLCLGMPLNRKRKQRSQNEAEK